MIGVSDTRTGCCLTTALLLVVCAPAAAQMGPVVARATSVTGRNLLYNAGGAPVALTPGFILGPGDRVDTRGGGKVVIDLSDGSMVVVQPESVIVLKDFQQASSLRELFEITLGNVRVKINHFVGRPNPYRMNSPTASIAVRGTEFSIEVGSTGDTRVVVYEGAVEVASLRDPDRKTLIEAGRGVLVQSGQDFHFIGRNDGSPGRFDPDHDHRPPAIVASGGQGQPQVQSAGKIQGSHTDGPPPPPGPAPHAEPHAEPQDSLRAAASASAYDRYVTGLSDIAQVPFLFRYNAFAERHLDSLENPAYASEFTTGEGRVFLLPSFRGVRGFEEYQAAFGSATTQGDYRISPQLSMFTPIGGSGFTVGGSAAASRVGNSGSTTDTFYSGALVLAKRSGATSFGVEAEALRGADYTSSISQSRFTAGISRDLTRTAKVGIFYRYSFLTGNDSAGPNSIPMSGHSSEVGLRLRGAISRRVSYGLVGDWLGVSLREGQAQRDRARRASIGFGLGYSLSRRTVLSFDVAGGTARTTTASRRFASVHSAVQTDLSRHLFVSASLLQLWQGECATAWPLGNRFSDFGAGWRFSPNFFAQYLYSTDYGFSPSSHTVMLRYTFRLRGE